LIGDDRMRSFLAALWLLTVAGIARTDFDAAGVASAKPKATQATGPTFDAGIAAKRTSPKSYPFPGGVPVVKLLNLGGFVYTVNLGDYTPPPVKNPSNIPRPKR
jgi:hypothetical protein